MTIAKKTGRWVEAGLITAEQAGQIVRFEQSSEKARWSKLVLRGFVLLGGCVVSIGIISLIAANWEEIPELVKLAAAFVVLAVLGAGSYWAKDRDREIAHEALNVVFLLGCLATIGLIAQVFHTGGEPYQALVFWLVIALPLAGLASRVFLPGLWVVGLLVCFFVWSLQEHNSLWSFLRHGDNVCSLFPMTALWTLGLAGLCTHAGRLGHFAASLRFWGMTAILVAVVVGDVFSSTHSSLDTEAFYPAFVILPMALVAVLTDARIATRREKVLVW